MPSGVARCRLRGDRPSRSFPFPGVRVPLNVCLPDWHFVLLVRLKGGLGTGGSVLAAATSNPAPVNPTRHLTVGRRLKVGKDRALPGLSYSPSLSQKHPPTRRPALLTCADSELDLHRDGLPASLVQRDICGIRVLRDPDIALFIFLCALCVSVVNLSFCSMRGPSRMGFAGEAASRSLRRSVVATATVTRVAPIDLRPLRPKRAPCGVIQRFLSRGLCAGSGKTVPIDPRRPGP